MYFQKISVLNEAKLKTSKRNELPDEEFGIPSTRQYPLNDKSHVEAAIRMFNHVDPIHEKELSKNIKIKMKKYGIPSDTVGDDNKLKKYM